MDKLRTAIFISGRGSNMQAIVEAARHPDFPIAIDVIISNRSDAKGLEFAKLNNIPSFVVPHENYKTREEFETALLGILEPYRIDLICLAGFMRLLTPYFINAYAGRIINIHPSLLPLYKGRDTHQRALDAGDAYTGASVHYVIPEMDAGDIILQEKIAIEDNDTAETLATKTLAIEHSLYSQAIHIVAEQFKAYTTPPTHEKIHGKKGEISMDNKSLENEELVNSWTMWVHFTSVLKYSVIGIVAILILMAIVWV